ncbi:hypothetical protein P9112_007478 [Eukaryota sp. TZLM1-RC]
MAKSFLSPLSLKHFEFPFLLQFLFIVVINLSLHIYLLAQQGFLSQYSLLFWSLVWFLWIAFFSFILISLTYLLFRALGLPLYSFYVFFYSSLTLFNLIPAVDSLLKTIAGLALKPSTLFLYVHSSPSSAPSQSIFSLLLDSVKMAIQLDWISTTVISCLLFGSIIVLILYHAFLSRRLSFKSNLFPFLVFHALLIVSSLFCLVLSPFLLSSSNNLVKLSTPPTTHFFFPLFHTESPFDAQRYNITLHPNLDAKVSLLRNMFPLPTDRFWLSDNFPLVHGSLSKLCSLDPYHPKCLDYQPPASDDIVYPDVFFVLWESLAGNFVSINNNSISNSTPHLKELFTESGVYYKQTVTTSCPTSNSWFSIYNQAFVNPHVSSISRTRVVFDNIVDLVDRSPGHYHKVYFSSTDPAFDGKDKWLKTSRFDDVVFNYENNVQDAGSGYTRNFNNDRILIDQTIESVKQFDRSNQTNKSLFAWLLTVSTHLPYTTFDSAQNVGSELPKTWLDRYVRALEYSDYHLVSRLTEFLKTRDRPTVVVFVGDHSAYGHDLQDSCPDCLSSPLKFNDQTFYSSALISFLGSDQDRKNLKIPPPGTIINHPVSTFDIASTIVDLVGSGEETTHGFGRSLLNDGLDYGDRKTLSLLSVGAEFGTDSSIIRIDWSGGRKIQTSRDRPTFVDPHTIQIEQDGYFELILAMKEAWIRVMDNNKVWHEDLLKNEVFMKLVNDSSSFDVEVEHKEVEILIGWVFIGIFLLVSVIIWFFVFLLRKFYPFFRFYLFSFRKKKIKEELLPIVCD